MPSLKMYFMPGTPMPDFPVPEGYSISNYQGPQDKQPWCECCKQGLLADDADEKTFDHYILEDPDIHAEEDVFFIDYQGEHVGTVCAYLRSEDQIGVMHMVGIRPDFRGKGLARLLGMLTCKKLIAQGASFIRLSTDDWRKSAVRSYLRAGFLPVEHDENAAAAWEALLLEFGFKNVQMLSLDGHPARTLAYEKVLNNTLQQYLNRQDYEKITWDCIQWIRDWFDANGPKSPAVIGISGGKDSSTVAALCVKALGKERVFGVLMPNKVQDDIEVARSLVKHLQIPYAEIDIHESVEAVKNTLMAGSNQGSFTFSAQMTTNLPPRIRMTTLYAVSQCMGGRVSNNCNRSENYVGYSTIFGDAAGDFSPLANLTVAEIRLIGKCLGLPDEFVEKIPSDGLCGKTDEDNLGFTYETLDTYILTGVCEDAKTKTLLDQKHKANLFKMMPMPEFHPSKEE